MSRFDVAMKIHDVTIEVDDRGNPCDVEVNSRTVFANRYSIGTTAWVAARSAGLKADAQVSLRSCEYAGQQRATIDGVEYEVEAAQDRGEFTRLTLKRRLGNG